jgi:hypothetical protein
MKNAQCIPDEFVLIWRRISCFLFGDEKPDFMPLPEGEHPVPQRCISYRETLLQLHPGIDMADPEPRLSL